MTVTVNNIKEISNFKKSWIADNPNYAETPQATQGSYILTAYSTKNDIMWISKTEKIIEVWAKNNNTVLRYYY